jgi:hypothetical protein
VERVKQYLRAAISLPPREVAIRFLRRVGKEIDLISRRRTDSRLPTYVANVSERSGGYPHHFRVVPREDLRRCAEQIASVSRHYLAHRFDLLGSGWVRVRHGMRCRGVESVRYDMGQAVLADREGRWLEGRLNPANRSLAQRFWRLVDEDYVPVDWHLDFKSGYRWSESLWYRDVPFGHLPGVDIKVPWELARMQHLPQLAWAHALAAEGTSGFFKPEAYRREYRNQILDFIATNPPRFGVNWVMPMDVGIRVVNWLVAHDLFRAEGAEFDDPFETAFYGSVYEHGRHIHDNLEWAPEVRGNHYLANIVGLLFAAAWLPSTEETDAWLALGVQELVASVDEQFHPDGSNFEASTSYHRLSAEMVLYGTVLVLGLPDAKRGALRKYDPRRHRRLPVLHPPPLPLYSLEGGDRLVPFPPWYLERLEKMAEFSAYTLKPEGHVPQIGDDDSGRFLKLQPVAHKRSVAEAKDLYENLEGYEELPDDADYWDEDVLDHRHLIAAINGLFHREDLAGIAGAGWTETTIVPHVAGDLRLSSYLSRGGDSAAERVRIGGDGDWERMAARWDGSPPGRKMRTEIPLPGRNRREGLRIFGYPDFGLYLFRSSGLFLAVRCGPVGQKGYGGHAHNDSLSIELNVDGEDWIFDPGTYLYTPFPERRNEYRSVKAHFAPRIGNREPGRLDMGLFRLGDEAKAEPLYFAERGFAGRHQGFGRYVYRIVEVLEDGIRIKDYVEDGKGAGRQEGLVPPEWERGASRVAFSPGYGRRRRR